MFFPGSYGKQGYGLEGLDDISGGSGDGLAEVTRVRQFFPETWVWDPTLMTDSAGRATVELTAPDSITNWKLRAVSTSPESGLGFASGDMVVFQDFFIEPDLPYAMTWNEEAWIPVSIFNYLDAPQDILLELEPGAGFEVIGEGAIQVEVPANSVRGATFPIRTTAVGSFPFKISARGQAKADAVIRPLLVEPGGTRLEITENVTLTAGQERVFDASFPASIVPGSEKIKLAVAGSQVAQMMNGVELLCGKPFG
jgi:CD109 antigen